MNSKSIQLNNGSDSSLKPTLECKLISATQPEESLYKWTICYKAFLKNSSFNPFHDSYWREAISMHLL